MANSQLSNSKFSVPNIFNSDTNKNNVKCKPKPDFMKKISLNIAQLKIKSEVTDTKSLDSLQTKDKISNDEWLIDLSKALKVANSQPNIKEVKVTFAHKTNTTMFTEMKDDILNNFKPTHLQSSILKVHYKLNKRVSNFGQVICCNFKRSVPNIVSGDLIVLCKMKRFAFTVPSPDDIIQTNLKVSKK